MIITILSLALRENSVDVVTFGQYMRPTKRHMKVSRYVAPAEFDMWKTRYKVRQYRFRCSFLTIIDRLENTLSRTCFEMGPTRVP
jgi:lipoate synthase